MLRRSYPERLTPCEWLFCWSWTGFSDRAKIAEDVGEQYEDDMRTRTFRVTCLKVNKRGQQAPTRLAMTSPSHAYHSKHAVGVILAGKLAKQIGYTLKARGMNL